MVILLQLSSSGEPPEVIYFSKWDPKVCRFDGIPHGDPAYNFPVPQIRLLLQITKKNEQTLFVLRTTKLLHTEKTATIIYSKTLKDLLTL